MACSMLLYQICDMCLISPGFFICIWDKDDLSGGSIMKSMVFLICVKPFLHAQALPQSLSSIDHDIWIEG